MNEAENEVAEIYLRVERKDIAYIKFIVESHEGVGIVRTLNRHSAVIVILAAPDFEDTAREIVLALSERLLCEEIPRPAEAMTDWLLQPDSEDGVS